jgi:hypothetical protein
VDWSTDLLQGKEWRELGIAKAVWGSGIWSSVSASKTPGIKQLNLVIEVTSHHNMGWSIQHISNPKQKKNYLLFLFKGEASESRCGKQGMAGGWGPYIDIPVAPGCSACTLHELMLAEFCRVASLLWLDKTRQVITSKLDTTTRHSQFYWGPFRYVFLGGASLRSTQTAHRNFSS